MLMGAGVGSCLGPLDPDCTVGGDGGGVVVGEDFSPFATAGLAGLLRMFEYIR